MGRNFKSPVAEAVESTIQELAPGARGAELVALFDGKTNTKRISDWRYGHRAPPQWAIELLRTKLQLDNERRMTQAAQMKTGPGRRAGAINIKKWNAANPR